MKNEFVIALSICCVGLPTCARAAEKGPQKAQQTAGFISDDDYPASAIRRFEHGTVLASFTIGVDGRVGQCGTYSGENIPILEAVTCFIIRERFVYKPARAADGKPIPEMKSQRITWQLPVNDRSNLSPGLPSLRPASLGISYRLGSDGRVTDCVATGTTFDGSELTKVCEELKWRQPIKDDRGQPVAKRVIEKHSAEIRPD